MLVINSTTMFKSTEHQTRRKLFEMWEVRNSVVTQGNSIDRVTFAGIIQCYVLIRLHDVLQTTRQRPHFQLTICCTLDYVFIARLTITKLSYLIIVGKVLNLELRLVHIR